MTDAVEVLRIDSLEDERLDAYVRLTERELRCVLEPQKGIFIAESAKVIERAVRARYEPVSFLLGERWLDQMTPLFERLVVREGAGPVPVFVASMELMEQLTSFNVTRGALAAFRRPRQIPVDEFLGGVVEAGGGRPAGGGPKGGPPPAAAPDCTVPQRRSAGRGAAYQLCVSLSASLSFGSTSGTAMVTVVPTCSVLVISSFAPCAPAMRAQSASPMPLPPAARLRDLSTM